MNSYQSNLNALLWKVWKSMKENVVHELNGTWVLWNGSREAYRIYLHHRILKLELIILRNSRMSTRDRNAIWRNFCHSMTVTLSQYLSVAFEILQLVLTEFTANQFFIYRLFIHWHTPHQLTISRHEHSENYKLLKFTTATKTNNYIFLIAP